jgi:EmrB/QacA subfamily drug resistance transporter
MAFLACGQRGESMTAEYWRSEPGRTWAGLALLCVANFLVILDAQIVILALPSIQQDLDIAAGAAQWVMSAYLITFGGFLLLGGRMGDLLGRRRVFLAGTAMFGVTSLVCGSAWTPEVLVAGRVVQGLSAAMMAPTALAILMTTFEEGAARNRALACWGGTGAVGATAALLIGGVLTGGLGWEWIFFINIPVAVLLLALGPRLLGESRSQGNSRGLDAAGAIAVTVALGLLACAIVMAPDAGWTSPTTIGLFIGAGIGAAAFIVVEDRSTAPLIPLPVFRSRNLIGGNVVMLLTGMGAWGVSVMASMYGQLVLGYSPFQFGVATVALTAMALVGSYAAQALVTRFGANVVAAWAAVLLGAGALQLSGVSADGTYFRDLFVGLLIFGFGLGAGTVAASVAALTGVAETEAGVASGTNTACFQLGGALGAAIVTTVALTSATDTGAAAMTDGLRTGFRACAVFAVIALVFAIGLLRRSSPNPLEIDRPSEQRM